MTEIISGSIYNEIRDKITKKIDLSKLPLYGEKEIFKVSASRYGKVKIKLEIEDDIEIIHQIQNGQELKNAVKVSHFTYKWEVDESVLPKYYENYIKSEIENFIKLLSVFRDEGEQILRFSIVDGGYKETERPGHMIAVKYALIELFKQI